MLIMGCVYLIIGIFSGLLSGLLGLGGGLIVVPALATYLNYANIIPKDKLMHVAISTSLAVMIFTTISAAISQARKQAIRWDLIWKLVPGLVLGLLFGTVMQNVLSTGHLQVFFGVFLIIMSYRVGFTRTPEAKGFTVQEDLRYIWPITFLMGTLGVVLGVGGGLLMLPYLLQSGVHIRTCISTTTVCGIFMSTIGTLLLMIFSYTKITLPLTVGYVYLPALIGIAMMSVLFAPFGTVLNQKISTEALKKCLAVFLCLVGIDMLFFT
jgi:uncharacterized membrane protein YfcA